MPHAEHPGTGRGRHLFQILFRQVQKQVQKRPVDLRPGHISGFQQTGELGERAELRKQTESAAQEIAGDVQKGGPGERTAGKPGF